jgi:class 3 adenylate cyclase
MSQMTVESRKRSSGPVAERRYLTIMFIDLVGFTRLSEQLDPEDLLVLQRRYQQLALTTMEQYGGFVGNFSGDGILVYFGYPTARGNDAERALRAGLEMIERLRGLDLTLHDGQAWRLEARIGVHTGLVVVGPELMSSGESAHGVVGEAVNIAARLQLEAPVGGVVASGDTRSLVEGLFDFASLGARPIKGLSRPVETFHVARARPGARPDQARLLRSAATMVGRETTLARLHACWNTVREQSRRQVVQIVGDAGLGKTRLVSEFCLRSELGGTAMLQTHCHEIFANTALYPVGSFLWKRAGLALEDDGRARRQKLGVLLDELGLAGAENQRIIASFP